MHHPRIIFVHTLIKTRELELLVPRPFYNANTRTRLTACASGKDGSADRVALARAKAGMQLPATTYAHRLRNTPLSAAGNPNDKRNFFWAYFSSKVYTPPDPSFPLAHAVNQVRACACIEGSGDQTKGELGLRLGGR